jgi:hypothetical protein
MGKMPRSFWSYTAGKGSPEAEEIAARREKMLQGMKQTLPGLLGFGVILLLTAIMLLMMLAEFRGFDILEQPGELFRVR